MNGDSGVHWNQEWQPKTNKKKSNGNETNNPHGEDRSSWKKDRRRLRKKYFWWISREKCIPLKWDAHTGVQRTEASNGHDARVSVCVCVSMHQPKTVGPNNNWKVRNKFGMFWAMVTDLTGFFERYFSFWATFIDSCIGAFAHSRAHAINNENSVYSRLCKRMLGHG